MPTTRSFHAKGRRNAFPYCLIKSDISSFSHWVTLGGYQKTAADAGTSVTQDQINLSFANGMKLFWNTYRFNIDIEVVGTNSGSTETYTKSFFKTGFILTLDTSTGLYDDSEPFERVCAFADAPPGNPLFLGSTITNREDVGNFFVNRAQYDISIHQYYNGSTSNESNFIGYGLGGLFFQSKLRAFSDLHASLGNRAQAIYRLDSITPEETGSISELDEIGYTTVSGIPFVYGVGTFATSVPSNETQPTESFDANGATVNNPYFGVSSKVITPSIDFYTYS
tara:strand:- start:52 stop:894 length:843 start_codon:yes stop_codon:yes gene_type:complete